MGVTYTRVDIDPEVSVYIDYRPLRASVNIDMATASMNFENSRDAADALGKKHRLKTLAICSGSDNGVSPTNYHGRVEDIADVVDWYLELPAGTTIAKIQTQVVHDTMGRLEETLAAV